MCILLAGIFVFSGCGEQSPTQAFNNWRSAIIAGNINAANELTGKGEAEMNGIYAEAVKDNVAEGKILKSGTIVSEEINGDKATIKMKGEDGKTADFVMIKTQGQWKISHGK